MKSKIYTALVIATSIGVFATHAFITGQTDTDLKATGGNTLLTEDRWNSLVDKVSPIYSQSDNRFVIDTEDDGVPNFEISVGGTNFLGPNSSGQGNAIIWGEGDGNSTYSALYLADQSKSNGNSWTVAHKKHVGQTTEGAFEIGKWKSGGHTVGMIIKEDMDVWFSGNIKSNGTICDGNNNCIGGGSSSSCPTTDFTINGDGANCSVSINQTGEHAQIKHFTYWHDGGQKTGTFQCFNGSWSYISGPCYDPGGF